MSDDMFGSFMPSAKQLAELEIKPGQIMTKEDFEKRQKLVAPPALPNAENFENSDMGDDWWCVVYPATSMHHALAVKLAGAKSGQMMPLTIDEMALLSEFMVWPKR